MADGIHPKFAENERLVPSEILQAAEVTNEVLLAVEIDVIAVEVDLAGEKVLGRREIGVSSEGEGIVLFDDVNERIEELLHPARAVPADEVGRDFVVDEEAEHGGVTRVGQGGLRNVLADGLQGFAVVEKEDALVPRDRDHDAQAKFLGEIEEPAGRRVIDAKHVQAEAAHQAEIDGYLLRQGQVDAALGCGPEWAVGHALKIELVFALKEKLRPHLQAGEISRGDGRPGNDIMHGAEFP
jgi:hypothetical protein